MAKALGKGLDALLPNYDKEEYLESICNIDINSIDINTSQPRKNFDKESLNHLAESIKSNGILSPILVSKTSGDRYQIIAGERRYRAARLAKLDSVPCIVKEMSKKESMQAAIIENIQREDLNPIEEAEALQSLIDTFNYTQEALSKTLGISRSSIANSLRLNSLSKLVKKAIIESKISFGHAKVLAGLQDQAMQEEYCNLIINNGLSVRDLELLLQNKKSSNKKRIQIKDADIKAFENDLSSKFGLKTVLQGNYNKGKIILSYKSKEELEHLYSIVQSLQQ